MEVINVKKALEMMGGYKVVYERLIQTFLDNQKNLIEELEVALQKDRSEARRLVHSCKGISQNLGAFSLYDISRDYEEAILNREEKKIPVLHQEFKILFNKVIEELQSIDFNTI